MLSPNRCPPYNPAGEASAEPWPHCPDHGPLLCLLGLGEPPLHHTGNVLYWSLPPRMGFNHQSHGLTATTRTFPLYGYTPS